MFSDRVAAAWQLCVAPSGTSSFVSAASWQLSLTLFGIAWRPFWPRGYSLRYFCFHAERSLGATRQGLRRRAVGRRLFVSSHFLNDPDGKSCNDFNTEGQRPAGRRRYCHGSGGGEGEEEGGAVG